MMDKLIKFALVVQGGAMLIVLVVLVYLIVRRYKARKTENFEKRKY